MTHTLTIAGALCALILSTGAVAAPDCDGTVARDYHLSANSAGVFGKECVQILGVGIESSCCDSDYSEYQQHEKGPGSRYQRTHPAQPVERVNHWLCD